MKRILFAMALALFPAAAAVVSLNAAPAMADPMMTPEARGLFLFPAYDAASFQARRAAGAPTLLVFTKQGCPVCTRQVRALQEVLKEPAFAGFGVQQVDFIGQAAIARQYGVTGQSTILAFNAGGEVSRRTGDVTPEAIRAQLTAALAR